MITLLVISTILLFIVGVLFVPIRIVVNTDKKQYYISLPGYLRADLLFGGNNPFRIKMRVLFISFLIEPSKRVKKQEIEHKEKKYKPIKNPLKLFVNLIRSIKVKYCVANIDTGDFPLNAQLIPIANLLQNKNVEVNINFNNNNNVDLKLETRGIKLIYIILKHKILNK
jgi:hypothetical protein